VEVGVGFAGAAGRTGFGCTGAGVVAVCAGVVATCAGVVVGFDGVAGCCAGSAVAGTELFDVLWCESMVTPRPATATRRTPARTAMRRRLVASVFMSLLSAAGAKSFMYRAEREGGAVSRAPCV